MFGLSETSFGRAGDFCYQMLKGQMVIASDPCRIKRRGKLSLIL